MTLRLCVCARAYQDPESGLCFLCTEERQHAEYVKQDHSFADAQRENWRERKRRQRHRDRYRPDEPLPDDADLFEVHDEALSLIESVRAHVRSPSAVAALDQLGELTKQLCWGPE